MVCKVTSCDRATRRAFTLAEYLIATTISLMVVGAAMVLWAYGSKTCASLLGYVELSNSSKIALDKVSQKIRNAKRIQSCNATQIVLLTLDGKTNSLTYKSSKQQLISTVGSTTEALLTGCTNLEFRVYQQTPKSNDSTLQATWDTNMTKVVQINWTCTRAITGDKSSIESQVSSKVVVRNPQ